MLQYFSDCLADTISMYFLKKNQGHPADTEPTNFKYVKDNEE